MQSKMKSKHLMQFSQASHNKYFKLQPEFTNQRDIQMDIFKGLSSREDIDKKFQQLASIKENQQTESQSKILRSKSPSVVPQSSNISLEQDRVGSHVKSIVKLIGTTTGSKPLKVKYQRLCHEYGINYKFLQSLVSLREKEDYVIQQMQTTIQEQLRQYDMNIQQYEQSQRISDHRIEAPKQDFLDLFDWVQVKSQYNEINKQLKYALVDAITDTNNQQQVQNYFTLPMTSLNSERTRLPHESDQLKTPYFSSLNSHRRLISVPTSTKSASNLLSTESPYHFDNEKQFNIINQMGFQVKQTSYLRSEESTVRQVHIQPKVPLKLEINYEVNQRPTEIAFKEWNQAIEQGFLVSRQGAHTKFTKEIDSTSWNSNGFYPILYEQIKKSGGSGIDNKKRDDLFNQYQQGNALTAQELKFLTNTSYLINRGIDKEFIQKAINYLESHVIQEIELNIAEQVLKRYQDSMAQLGNMRKVWLNKKNETKKNEILSQAKDQRNKQQHHERKEQLIRTKQKIVAFLKEIARKKCEKDRQDTQRAKLMKEKRLLGDPLANKYVVKFKQKMMSYLRKRNTFIGGRGVSEDFLQRNGPKSPPKAFYVQGSEEITVQQVKRQFHPSSKVLMDQHQNNEERIIRQETLEKNKLINQKEVRKFKIGIRNYQANAESFKQFYSGGPVQDRAFSSKNLLSMNDLEYGTSLPQNQKWINQTVEEIAINKIKSAIRQFIHRKKYKRVLEEREYEKTRAMEIQIKRFMEARKLMDSIHTMVSQQRAKKLHKRMSSMINIKRKSTQVSPKSSFAQKIAQTALFEKKSLAEKMQIQQDKGGFESPKNQLAMGIKTGFFDILDSVIGDEDQQPKSPLRRQVKAPTYSQQQYNKQKERSDNKLKHRKLIVASKMGNLLIAQTAGFTYNKNDVNCTDSFGNCPLYYCAANKDEVFCKFLLKLGADVNKKCSEGNTPVHMAFQSGHIGIIIEFLSSGGDLNVLNDSGNTPIAFGNDSMLALLNLNNLVSAHNQQQPSQPQFDNNLLFNTKFPTQEPTQDRVDVQVEYLSDGLKILSKRHQKTYTQPVAE